MAMAMRSHLDLGIRYILPIYPFLFILIGVAAGAGAETQAARTHRAVDRNFRAGPGHRKLRGLSEFYPVLSMRQRVDQAWRDSGKLSDSNIDWGQDLPAMAKWQDDNPHRRFVFLLFWLRRPAIL